jgi:hypothetical protein
MNKGKLAGMIWLVLAAAALFLGWQALRISQEVAVVIAWETASEMDTAGFNLYRGDQETGPFQQVNAGLIPGADDPLTGGSYEFVDSNVTAGTTYYYQLEEVELSGARVVVETTSVQAAAGGQLELATAGIMLLIAVIGVFRQLQTGRKTVEGTP